MERYWQTFDFSLIRCQPFIKVASDNYIREKYYQAFEVPHLPKRMQLSAVNAVSFFWINSWRRLNAVLVEAAANNDLLHCNQITFSYEFSASLSQHLNESHQWRSSMEKHKKEREKQAHTHPHTETTLKGTLKSCLTSGKSTNETKTWAVILSWIVLKCLNSTLN